MHSVNRALAWVVLVAGCGEGGGTPSRPSAMAQPAVAVSPGLMAEARQQVAGVVYEITAAGRRPLAGVGIDMSVEYQSWPPQVTSDGEGRYSFIGSAPDGHKLIAEKAGYSQPCRVPVQPDRAEHDIYLVANGLLSTSGLPASFPVVPPVLNGLVFEDTADGRHPIADATVVLDFTGGMGWAPSARTRTDAQGRYLVCNVVSTTGFGFSALVNKPGYAQRFVDVTVPPGTSFDIELKRQ